MLNSLLFIKFSSFSVQNVAIMAIIIQRVLGGVTAKSSRMNWCFCGGHTFSNTHKGTESTVWRPSIILNRKGFYSHLTEHLKLECQEMNRLKCETF